MDVNQAIGYVREWVETQADQLPGFRGAHLMGGTLTMPKSAPFPLYRDIDFNIVCDGVRETSTHDVAYKGLILEYSIVGVEQYRTPEAVLANPELACNLAADSVLVDSFGLLAPLHQAVATQYARRDWVKARCDHERGVVLQALAGVRDAASPVEALWSLTGATLFLSGLLAEASLRPPTHRRCLVLMRDVLQQQGRDDLHEAVLRMLGFAHLQQSQVEAYLDDCAAAFDRACEVTCTPVPFQFKFQPHIRPYIVEGAREMIDQGWHREAMFWICGFLTFTNAVIQADAPADERPIFQANVDRLVADMGLCEPAVLVERAAAAQDISEAIFGLADDLVERIPAEKGA